MLSFDYTPIVYWALGYALAGLVVWTGVGRRFSNLVYLCLSMALLVMMRLPAVVFNRELNPDESQMASHGITLYYDPVYWQSVDGTTIGPLDNYLLVLPRLLGFQVDYTAARVMGLLCAAGALLFFFGAVRRWFGDTTARLAFLFPLLFLSFTQETDYVHYSSEQLPVLLLGACLWLLACLSSRPISASAVPAAGVPPLPQERLRQERLAQERLPQPFLWRAYLLGFVAGMIPFAKLQAVPQAAVLALAGVWITYRYFRQNGTYKSLVAILVGGISFPVLAFVWMLYHQVFTDFIDFYLHGNAIYAGDNSIFSIPVYLVRVVALSPDFLVFTIVLLLPVFISIRSWLQMPSGTSSVWGHHFLPLFITAYLLASFYAATKSGNSFVHYLALCIPALALASVYGLHWLRRQKIAWAWLLPALWLLWFIGTDAYLFLKHRRINEFMSIGATSLPDNPLVTELEKYTQPGDYMVVWGWQCRYYVEAQLPHGTALNHSERTIYQHPLRDTYRTHFMNDIQRNQPAVLVDAIDNSLWLGNRATDSFESFPELARYVEQNYRYAGTFDKSLLYIRKDRYEAKKGVDPELSVSP